jgi:hypothetical protein
MLWFDPFLHSFPVRIMCVMRDDPVPSEARCVTLTVVQFQLSFNLERLALIQSSQAAESKMMPSAEVIPRVIVNSDQLWPVVGTRSERAGNSSTTNITTSVIAATPPMANINEIACLQLKTRVGLFIRTGNVKGLPSLHRI